MLDSMPISEEFKTFLITHFISLLGMHLHFPVETFFMNLMMWQSFLFTPVVAPQSAASVVIDPFLAKKIWDTFRLKLQSMAAYSLKLMLYRMHIKPLSWRPMDGALPLVSALRTHMYLFCMGDLGAHVFYYQKQVDYHPELGYIYSGPLQPINRPSTKFFSLHAIVVIGIRSRGFMKGDVYFIDPADPSGPGLLQKVYLLSVKDFFCRIRDSAGCGDMRSVTREFVWAGDPNLFLA